VEATLGSGSWLRARGRATRMPLVAPRLTAEACSVPGAPRENASSITHC
jgi:hypothetical protein